MANADVDYFIAEFRKNGKVDTESNYNIDYEEDYNRLVREYRVISEEKDYLYFLKKLGGGIIDLSYDEFYFFAFYGFTDYLLNSIFTGPQVDEEGYFLFSEILLSDRENSPVYFFSFLPGQPGIFMIDEEKTISQTLVYGGFLEFLKNVSNGKVLDTLNLYFPKSK